MLVINMQNQKIGRLNKQFGNLRDGEMVALWFVNGHHHMNVTAPVVVQRRRFSVGEEELINRGVRTGSKPNKNELIALACYDREFRELVEEPGSSVEVQSDVMTMRIIVEVRVPAICADLDTAEKLFDMDEFEPA